jgi:hypothetical protein
MQRLRIAGLGSPRFDAGADPLACGHQTLLPQMLDRLPHRVSRYSERGAELGFRRQQGANGVLAIGDAFTEGLRQLDVERLAAITVNWS